MNLESPSIWRSPNKTQGKPQKTSLTLSSALPENRNTNKKFTTSPGGEGEDPRLGERGEESKARVAAKNRQKTGLLPKENQNRREFSLSEQIGREA